MSDNEPRPIVVGVDGSPAGQAALHWAVDESRRRGCPLDAVSAWHRDYGMIIGALPVHVAMELSPEGMRAGQQAVLDEATNDIEGVEIRRILTEGDPRTVLTEASRDAELLVVGNRGHGPIAEAILGSVSSYCVHHAACPVVVIREVRARQDEHADEMREPLTPGPLL